MWIFYKSERKIKKKKQRQPSISWCSTCKAQFQKYVWKYSLYLNVFKSIVSKILKHVQKYNFDHFLIFVLIFFFFNSNGCIERLNICKYKHSINYNFFSTKLLLYNFASPTPHHVDRHVPRITKTYIAPQVITCIVRLTKRGSSMIRKRR